MKNLRDTFGFFEPELKPWRTVRDALKGVPDPRTKHGIPDHNFRDLARTYPGHTGSDFDLPAKTIKAGGHGVPGGENMMRFHDGSVRYFTVFEGKRMQTFPDDSAQPRSARGLKARQVIAQGAARSASPGTTVIAHLPACRAGTPVHCDAVPTL